jgi:hypothetical protein
MKIKQEGDYCCAPTSLPFQACNMKFACDTDLTEIVPTPGRALILLSDVLKMNLLFAYKMIE